MKYSKVITLFLLLILSCASLVAQIDDGAYQGFKVNKNAKEPDIVTIHVLSLGNGVCQFSEGTNRKPLQGAYHIIIKRNKYYIGNFRKGIANGTWEEYFYNSLYEKGTFKDGKYDGKVYEYGSNGLENKYPGVSTVRNGVMQHYISYFSNGQIEKERFYDENGQFHGEMITYNKEGKVIGIENYQHGYQNGKSMLEDSQGYKTTSEYTRGKITGEYCRFYPNGNIQKKGTYDENGKRCGEWVYRAENGDLQLVEHLLNDQLHGEVRNYYKGNVLQCIEEYAKGELNGKRTDYDESPHVISQETMYANGRREGEFKIYHTGILWREGVVKNGRTIYEKEYQDGKLQIVRLLDEEGDLVNVEQYNGSGQKTYKNKNYKKHPSIQLKENSSGVIDVE